MDEDDYKTFAIVTAVIVAIAASVYILVTYRSTVHVQVTQVSWSRAIDIQRWQTVQESAWSVPQGGRETRHYSAFHHYDHVMTGSHSVCSGAGKTQSCRKVYDYTDYPVYETKYDYLIDRWITVRTPERHGIGHDAVWPDVSDLKTHETLTLGDERAGMRTSRYTVAFTQDYSLDITEGRWRDFKPGQPAILVLNIFKQALDVKAIS